MRHGWRETGRWPSLPNLKGLEDIGAVVERKAGNHDAALGSREELADDHGCVTGGAGANVEVDGDVLGSTAFRQNSIHHDDYGSRAVDLLSHRSSPPRICTIRPSAFVFRYGFTRPILLPSLSVIQMFPSGPTAIPWGKLVSVGIAISQMAPLVVM